MSSAPHDFLDVPPLASDRVRCVPVVDAHLDLLYQVAATDHVRWPRMHLGGVLQAPSFPERLWAAVLTQHLVLDRRGDPVGLTAIYRSDHVSGTAWFEVVSFAGAAGLPDRSTAHERDLSDATALIVNHAFASWRFRKLYTTYFAGTYAPAVDLGLAVVEASFGADTLVAGTYVDRIVAAVYQERWTEVREGLLAEIGALSAVAS